MLITVFGPPLGTIHGGVPTDTPISVIPITLGTTGGIAPGIPVGMIHGIQAGTTPGIMDMADMAGTTIIGIHGITTDTIRGRVTSATTIRMLLTVNALQQTARVTATHRALLPAAPCIQEGAKAEVPKATIPAEYIRVHAAPLRRAVAAVPSTNAVPAALPAVRATSIPAHHALRAGPTIIIPTIAEALPVVIAPARAGVLPAVTVQVAAGVLQASIAVVADIAAVVVADIAAAAAAAVAAVVEEVPEEGDNSKIKM